MSGKAYTMKEMKAIVEYLTERKAFSEIKGRKMWMEFATTKLTNRTWQSLKETFLKRILPDIHNPYYKLSMDQIRSFRQGYDVVAKDKTRLMIRTESDSDSNAETSNQEASPNNNHKEADEPPGETIKSSQITSRNRSSAETVILEKCYETADEIRKDLESPKADVESRTMNEISISDAAVKPLTDILNNCEPTPMTSTMQKLLDDFASEPESENELEPQQTATEVNPDNEEGAQNDVPDTETIIIISSNVADEEIPTDAIDQPANEDENSKDEPGSPTVLEEAGDSDVMIIEDSCVLVIETNTIGNGTEPQDDTQIPNNGINEQTTSDLTTSNMTKTDSVVCEKNETSAQNCSNTTTDASLPNNPEGFNKTDKVNGLNSESNTDKTKGKKRSNSSDIDTDSKKKKKLTETIENAQTKAAEEGNSKAIDAESVEASKDIVEEQKDVSTISNDTTRSNQDMSMDAPAHIEIDAQVQNPCLKSVSLYEEQFNKIQYLDSEPSGDEIPTKQPETSTNNNKEKKMPKVSEEVNILKSHSEAGNNHNGPEAKIKHTKVVSTKIHRDKAMANVFGFAGVSSSHKNVKRSSHKKSRKHQYEEEQPSSESGEWTSQSDDSEMYVSPPRGKKSRHTRKYLKPQSARVLSLDEEGGLFVMHGKKIFPLVKDGKTVKNYVTYLPDSDSEENDTYWKHKYFEEKNKAEELRTLLEKQMKTTDTSPILRTTTSRNSTSGTKSRHSVQSVNNDQEKVIVIGDDENKAEEKKRDKQEKVKIKFTKNNEEVHLEGHWQQLHPMLEQVVQIFHKESDHGDKPKPAMKEADKRPDSGICTPIAHHSDPEVKNKIDQIEKQIFQQIEELDAEEQSKGASRPQVNVTKRKVGRPRKISSSPPQSPAKKPRISKQAHVKSTANDDPDQLPDIKLDKPEDKPPNKLRSKSTDNKTISTNNQETKQLADNRKNEDNIEEEVPNKETTDKLSNKELDKSPDKSNVAPNVSPGKSESTEDKIVSSSTTPVTSTVNKRKTRTPKKFESELETASNTSSMQTRRSSARKSGSTPTKKVTRSSAKIENTQTKTTSKSTRSKSTRRSHDAAPVTTPPDLMKSIDSTQGYQDSDISPPNMILKKRKKLNLSTLLNRARRSGRRRTFSVPDISSDSSNSSFNIPAQKSRVVINSSLNTEVYRSESYQLLMPQPRPVIKLTKIDEACPVPNLIVSGANDHKSLDEKINSEGTDSNHGVDVGSSSNVSLPISPELSIVERLSLTREMIDCVEEPTLNEINTQFVTDPELYDNYMISAVDVSVPLMEQECGLEHTDKNLSNQLTVPNTSVVSQSLLTKVGNVNIKDNSSLFRSLDQKLQELLLESAKKITQNKDEGNEMEVDVTSNVETKKAVSTKRCSTPRKRKATQKAKQPNIETVVEEHIESCSRSGRKSCPPVINVLPNEMKKPNINEPCFDNTMQVTTANKPKKQKKDVIKVKIVRPKDKKKDKTSNNTRMSINTDSGINHVELGITFNNTNDSVELIHNHSETCLQANECIGSSVEFIETSSTSVISLNSNPSTLSLEQTQGNLFEFGVVENIPPELFCNNAQDVTGFQGIKASDHQTGNTESQSNSEYHSPLNTECLNDSMLTEDLSDEPPCHEVQEKRPTKWYLLSEDETTIANIGAGAHKQNNNFSSFGSSLKQLFPIACAVPDLSTISEMSKENDDSRKATLDEAGDTRNDMDSQSLFK